MTYFYNSQGEFTQIIEKFTTNQENLPPTVYTFEGSSVSFAEPPNPIGTAITELNMQIRNADETLQKCRETFVTLVESENQNIIPPIIRTSDEEFVQNCEETFVQYDHNSINPFIEQRVYRS